MSALFADLNYGLRSLAKNPGFTAVVVFTLTLGIGANVAMFSVVDAVLLKGLPFPEADRLVLGRTTYSGDAAWSQRRGWRRSGIAILLGTDSIRRASPRARDEAAGAGDRCGGDVAPTALPSLPSLPCVVIRETGNGNRTTFGASIRLSAYPPDDVLSQNPVEHLHQSIGLTPPEHQRWLDLDDVAIGTVGGEQDAMLLRPLDRVGRDRG